MKKIEDWWKCNFDLNSFFLQLNRYFGSLQIIKKCIHSYWKAVLPFQIYIGLAFAGKLNKTFEVQLKAWGCLWNENWGISRELTTDSADRCGPQKLQIASNLFKFTWIHHWCSFSFENTPDRYRDENNKFAHLLSPWFLSLWEEKKYKKINWIKKQISSFKLVHGFYVGS